MKKLVAVIVLLLTTLITVGCSGGTSSISGTYKNDQNSDEYFVFSSGGSVKYYNNGQSISGAYVVTEDVFVAVRLSDESVIGFVLTDDDTLMATGSTKIYVKENFWLNLWNEHWWQIIIGLVILGVIGMIGEKISEFTNRK